MKKIIMASLAVSLSVTCLAEEIPALTIKTENAESAIMLKDIYKVQYTDTEMVIRMNDGSSKSFAIDDIKEMSFVNADEATSISTSDRKKQRVTAVFDLNGIRKGNAANKGIYIIKTDKETRKIKK